MPKITVFEVPGTNVTASVTGQLQYISPEEIAKGDIYQGLNSEVFDYVFIQGHINALKPLQKSVDQGVAILSSQIINTPGPFAIVGTSQGALIGAQVYKKLKSNEIPRLNDCVGAFFMGSPAREAGKAFPGATSVSPGHGIANASFRLTGTLTDDRVWEFANPGDPVCCNGDDPVSVIRELAFNSMLTSFNGTPDPITNALLILTDPANALQVVQDLFGLLSFAVTTAPGMAIFHGGSCTYSPIFGDSRSALQIIVDRLNTIAGPAYRSDGWSATLTPPTY